MDFRHDCPALSVLSFHPTQFLAKTQKKNKKWTVSKPFAGLPSHVGQILKALMSLLKFHTENNPHPYSRFLTPPQRCGFCESERAPTKHLHLEQALKSILKQVTHKSYLGNPTLWACHLLPLSHCSVIFHSPGP